MIRSTKVTLKYANQNKKETLVLVLSEYKKVTQFFVDYLWNNTPINGKIPTLLPKEVTEQATTFLSKRMIQCSAKQASGIVRGCRRKIEKRLYILNKLKVEGRFKQARKLAHIIKMNPIGKPELHDVQAELDSRFVEIEYDNETSFDGWINLGSIGNKLKLTLPFNSHKHLNLLKKQGKQMSGLRISEDKVTFMFELEKEEKNTGKTIGIDIGIITPFTSSDGTYCEEKCNGHTMQSVCKRLSLKKKGSKGFFRTVKHRTNLIGFYNNKLDWNNTRKIRIENIRNLRYKRSSSRYLSHFVYREFFDKLKQTAERQGVLVEQVCPTYTSQRCSCCGWTRRRNRNGKKFECSSCGFATDADFNASVNISLDLAPIRKSERCKRLNLTGFFWLVQSCSSRQELTVPVVHENSISCFS